MINRLARFDWGLFFALALIAASGLLTLASSGGAFFARQLIWCAVAFPLIVIVSFVNWRWLGGRAWFRYGFYGLAVLLLVVSSLQSGTIRGTKSWIVVGDFQFEPVELAKLALIILFAHFFSRRHVEAWYGKNILLSFLFMVVPTALVVAHPDLGSALMLLILWLGFLLFSGIHTRRFLVGIALVILALALAWSFMLRPYQKDRILAFLLPTHDPLGANYNVIQAKIAIGSGGFFGKGFGGGTQARLHFLPAAHNDFIFAAFVEEWGIAGGALLLALFLYALSRIIRIGRRAADNYSRFLALGTGVLFAAQAFVNVGSNVGLTPVTGITFPFLSYGGSSLLTAAVLVGILEYVKVESST